MYCGLLAHNIYKNTAKPIEIPCWMKAWVGPRNHVLDRVQIPKERGMGNFAGCPGQSKAVTIFAASVDAVAVAFAAKGSFNRQ